MPRYDYECSCGRKWEEYSKVDDRDKVVCTCGKKAERLLFSPGNSANADVFQPMVYEDICETPILITSKKQLKEECSKRNLIAARLL